VIINADDFGITKGVNKAILELINAGVLTSTSVMSNMPDYSEMVNVKNGIGIGVHCNLTVGKPVTEPRKVNSLVNEKKTFLGLSELIKKTSQGKICQQETAMELDAQINRIVDMGIKPDHINSHESLIKYPFFSSIIRQLALKHGIKGVRTYTPRKFNYDRLLSPRKIVISIFLELEKLKWRLAGFAVTDRYDSLLKTALDYETALDKLQDIFQKLIPGVYEIAVHPGYCSGDRLCLGGYVQERETEFQALLSSEFKKIINKSSVELITYRDIL
jgi:predicted glycoside hydrolase/deacetylase ChbG (UPF0249 family)